MGLLVNWHKWFQKKDEEPPVLQKDTEALPESFMGKGAEHVSPDVPQKPTSDFRTARDMQDSILDLCRLLSRKTIVEEADCEKWVKKLETYLSYPEDRLMYSAISNYIFDKKEKELGIFGTNLDSVLHYVEGEAAKNPKDERWGKIFKAVLKFYDHSNLAVQQQKLVNKKRMDLEREVEVILTPKVSAITKEMTQQLVGLIGIFTALSFIVFGGISSLDSIFGAVQGTLEDEHSVLPVLIIAIAWALCMMNLLFGFMYFVIRITHLQKPVDEKALNLVQRYPAVVLCNYVLVAMIVLFGGMWFAECNGVGKFFFNLAVKDENSSFTFVIFVVMFGLSFRKIGRWLWSLYKQEKPETGGAKTNATLEEKSNEQPAIEE